MLQQHGGPHIPLGESVLGDAPAARKTLYCAGQVGWDAPVLRGTMQALGPEQDPENSWPQGRAVGAGQIHGTCIPVSHLKILGGIPP